MTQAEVDAQIAMDLAMIAGWNAALLADAAAPQADYSLDGEATSRQRWRAELSRLIDEKKRGLLLPQQTYNALNSYWISTRQVL